MTDHGVKNMVSVEERFAAAHDAAKEFLVPELKVQLLFPVSQL